MLALAGYDAQAQQWIRLVPQTANAPFLEKMLAFLRDAPQQALQRLYAHAHEATHACPRAAQFACAPGAGAAV
ncbi:hypothetical protein [Cupriavidus necator]|uniref:hypothetical protein n=1 Tax=Cupriavidus necator TaxID=106590 RepID=UPI0039C4DBA7